MPGHYKKMSMSSVSRKAKKMKKMKKRKQKGGQKKTARKKMCMCHQMGGSILTPAQMKMLMRPVRKFNTMPVNPKMTQQGMGHCGGRCGQCGGNIFDSIGKAFKKVGKSIVSNPLRLAGAIGTLGLSETFLTPAQLVKDATGVKVSKVLDTTAPVISAVGGPELALGSKFTSIGLKQMGLGKQPMLI